jgi:hypothetical protein
VQQTEGEKVKKLVELGKEIFGDKKFDAFTAGIGILAMNYLLANIQDCIHFALN